jgi:hypothetical protein
MKSLHKIGELIKYDFIHFLFFISFLKVRSAEGKGARLREITPCRKDIATP